jgi:GTP pyrophosphokinase
MKLKPDIASIQACILHDVIEDTPYTYEDIKSKFGEEVANLCE